MHYYAGDIKSLHIIDEIGGFCDVVPEIKINLIRHLPSLM